MKHHLQIVIFITLAFQAAVAQDSVPSAILPANNSGDLPYSTQIGSSVEHVELATGNLIINIPFVSLPGRKLNYEYGIRYDASFWTSEVQAGYNLTVPEQRNWLTPTVLGWTSNQPYMTYVSGSTMCQNVNALQNPGSGPFIPPYT